MYVKFIHVNDIYQHKFYMQQQTLETTQCEFEYERSKEPEFGIKSETRACVQMRMATKYYK